MNDGMVFYRSFMEAASVLPAEEYKEAVSAVLTYGLDGTEPENLSPYAKMFFLMAKPQIDANNARREAGRKGGEAKRDNANSESAVAKSSNATVCYTEEKEKEKEKVKEKVKEKECPPKSPQGEKRPRFTPPTPEQVRDYCKERGNTVDAERFCDFYAAKGWKVGNAPMKDWKAAVRTWERRGARGDTQGGSVAPEAPPGFNKFWSAYPKHSGIDDAKREWTALAPDEALCENILRAVAWRKGTEPWKEQQGKFVPAPAKWLHDHGWTDYKPPQRSGAVYEGMGPRDPDVEENWDAIMGEQIKAIRGY